MDRPDALGRGSGACRSRSEDPARARRSVACVRRRRRGPCGDRTNAAHVADGRRSAAHRSSRAAGRSRFDPRAWAVVLAASVRRAWRALQRDVRLGQLLHPARSAARRTNRVGSRHDRQFPVRDRALRDDSQREPHVLHDALAAAVPHRNDPRRVRANARSPVAALDAAVDRSVLRILDDAPASGGGDRTLALLRHGRRPGTRGHRRRARRAGANALRPRSRVLPHARGRRLRRGEVLRSRTRPPDRSVLQGRPVDARVRLRSVKPLRPVQRRHHQLRARLPECAAVPHGRRCVPHQHDPREQRRIRRMADARTPPAGAHRSVLVGSGRRAVLRLQLRGKPPAAV